jgi:uncharacterized membrane protein
MAILKTRQVAAIGIMGALATIATMIFTFPIPATSGYFNLGDSIVIITSLTFGWYNWVIFTTVIKEAEGYIAGHMAGDQDTRTMKKTVTAWLVGGAVMVGGYFIVQVFMYGFAAALSELPFNMVQMIVAGVVGIPISNALKDRLEL